VTEAEAKKPAAKRRRQAAAPQSADGWIMLSTGIWRKVYR